jgi:phage portal protein BeeE
MIQLNLKQPERRDMNPLENPAVPLSAGVGWGWLGGGSETDAGETVNDRSAMQLSTVYSCVKILSESCASLPLQLFTKTPTGRSLETANPLAHLIGVEPNDEMTAFSFYETMVAHMAITGNSYSQIP